MKNESRKQWLSYLATADENYLISLWDNLNMKICLLYTSPSPRDNPASRMPSSA